MTIDVVCFVPIVSPGVATSAVASVATMEELDGGAKTTVVFGVKDTAVVRVRTL